MKNLLNKVLYSAQQMVIKVESISTHLKVKMPFLAQTYQDSLASLDKQKQLRDQYYHNTFSAQTSESEYRTFCLVVSANQKKHKSLCAEYFSTIDASVAADVFLSLLKADIHILHVNVKELDVDEFILHLKENFSVFNSRLNLLIKMLKKELIHFGNNKSLLEDLENIVINLRTQLIDSHNNENVVSAQSQTISRFLVQEISSEAENALDHTEKCHKLLTTEYRILSTFQDILYKMEGDIFDKFIFISKQDTKEVSIHENRVFISLMQLHMDEVVKAGILPSENPFKPKTSLIVNDVKRGRYSNTFFESNSSSPSTTVAESSHQSNNISVNRSSKSVG